MHAFLNKIKSNECKEFFSTSWNYSSKPVLICSTFINFMQFAVPFVKQSAS